MRVCVWKKDRAFYDYDARMCINVRFAAGNECKRGELRGKGLKLAKNALSAAGRRIHILNASCYIWTCETGARWPADRRGASNAICTQFSPRHSVAVAVAVAAAGAPPSMHDYPRPPSGWRGQTREWGD